MCFLNATVPQHFCFEAGNVMALSSIFHKSSKATAFFQSSAKLLSRIVQLQRKHAGISEPLFKDSEGASRQSQQNSECWTKSSILSRSYSSIASPAPVVEAIKEGGIDLTQYPPERIRNFSIIAHVDHGKSTMADRLLELTGTIKKGHGQPQYLDKLQVERERGITVKAQTVTLFYNYAKHSSKLDTSAASNAMGSSKECRYLLNLIDTPGHVDFSYEVSRSLAACQGVLLLVDASQGVQAQTVANFYLAFEADLVIIPVINKIDQPNANPENVKNQLKHMFDIDPQDVLLASAKTGMGLSAVLPAVIDRIRYPKGQVGYIVTGMRSTQEARIGDTLHHVRTVVEPLPGFKPAKHMVFAGVYPADGSDYDALSHAIERLTCNDASVSVAKESSGALGIGFRCGFLGLLHMDVFLQRLEQEYGVHVITTSPTVPYIFEYEDGSKIQVQNPAVLSSTSGKRLVTCWEPTVIATIITPSEYLGSLITLCSERRGQQTEHTFIDDQRALLKYRLPLREVVVDFYNELKSITSGYASFDYEDAEYQEADLVKLDIMLNAQIVDALSTIVHRSKAPRIGREVVEKLKKLLDRQMFEVAIQAAIGSKVIARETISAMRKNVLAKCYGGDVTRKRKLLEKQKEGKKRMKRVGSVDIPQEAFHQLLRTT